MMEDGEAKHDNSLRQATIITIILNLLLLIYTIVGVPGLFTHTPLGAIAYVILLVYGIPVARILAKYSDLNLTIPTRSLAICLITFGLLKLSWLFLRLEDIFFLLMFGASSVLGVVLVWHASSYTVLLLGYIFFASKQKSKRYHLDMDGDDEELPGS